jgi:hypothetical protein
MRKWIFNIDRTQSDLGKIQAERRAKPRTAMQETVRAGTDYPASSN